MKTLTTCCHLKTRIVHIFGAALATLSLAAPCLAADSYELDLTKIHKVESTRDIRPEDIQQVIPTDLKATHNQGEVMGRIADHALRNWMNSPTVRNSRLGKTSRQVEQRLQTDVSLGKSEDAQIEHKVKLQVEPGHAQAIVKYSGLVDANVSYRASNAEWKFELSQKLNESADLVINRVANNSERIDNLSLRWTF